MANLNKVMLIGRLTRDVESRSFSNGGKVAKFGFAVNNRKKNTQSGQWEDEPVYLDCEAFNRGESGKLADTVERFCRKGSQIFIEGHLVLEQWNDKTSGEKRSKLKIVVDQMQLMDRKQDGDGGDMGDSGMGSEAPAPMRSANRGGFSGGAYSAGPGKPAGGSNGSGFGNKSFEDSDGRSGSGGGDDEVPF